MHKVLDPQWTYDKVLNKRLAEARKYEHIERDEPQELRLEGLLKMLHSPKKNLDYFADLKIYETNKALDDIKNARPIAIGPATLDSLYEEEPDTLEYVINEQLPFDEMFFEFIKPMDIELPLVGTKSIAGMEFRKSDPGNYSALLSLIKKEADQYDAIMYEPGPQGVNEHKFSFRPDGWGVMRGVFDKTVFFADMYRKKISYTDTENTTRKKDEGMLKKAYRAVMKNWMDHSRSMQQEEFRSMQNLSWLCTNTINYINAQRTEMVKAERDVKIRINDGKKNRVHKEEFPFYLVPIQSRTITEPEEPTGKTWQLEERIVVRGHNRMYRNDDGSVRMVTWIEPHIRGPEDAPWRNQRHAVLGEYLAQEREFIRKYQPKPIRSEKRQAYSQTK